MNQYANFIKDKLNKTISEVDDYSYLFTKNPEKDFTRKRKLDFKKMIDILLTMGGKSLKLELYDNFSYSSKTPTSAAFVQRRHKILPEAFEYIFHHFTKSVDTSKTYNGYRLLAVDGSDLCISHNPHDEDTYYRNSPKAKGFNLLHLDALYDLCNRTFVDAKVSPGRKTNERKGLINMISRQSINEKTIIIADRGYESYNVFEHVKANGGHYLIRLKDIKSNGIASSVKLPNTECFDIDVNLMATRRNTNIIKANPHKYKYMPQNQNFDFLPVGSKGTYPINYRIVRFPLSEGTYEVLITSLDRDNFPAKRLKELYYMRWGIETSFRELKYALGLTNFHSKKPPFILQEIFARLTMYNFCSFITMHTIIMQKNKRKHIYQVNYTIAISICIHFYKYQGVAPPDIEALIQMNILPVRTGRSDSRKVKSKATVSFLYRVA